MDRTRAMKVTFARFMSFMMVSIRCVYAAVCPSGGTSCAAAFFWRSASRSFMIRSAPGPSSASQHLSSSCRVARGGRAPPPSGSSRCSRDRARSDGSGAHQSPHTGHYASLRRLLCSMLALHSTKWGVRSMPRRSKISSMIATVLLCESSLMVSSSSSVQSWHEIRA